MQRNKIRGEIFLQNKVLFLFSWVVRIGEGDKTLKLQDPIILLMELHNLIFKASLISNYTALFELWGSIKLTHRILVHAIF